MTEPKMLRCIGGPYDGTLVEAKTTRWVLGTVQDALGATLVGTYVYEPDGGVYRWEDLIEPVIPA